MEGSHNSFLFVNIIIEQKRAKKVKISAKAELRLYSKSRDGLLFNHDVCSKNFLYHTEE